MARRRYSFHRLAVLELDAERRHYRREADAELAQAFVTAVEDACARVSEAPESFAPVTVVREVTIRSARVKRFPFRVYFADLGDRLRVYAVAHVRRRPGYWARRVGG